MTETIPAEIASAIDDLSAAAENIGAAIVLQADGELVQAYNKAHADLEAVILKHLRGEA